MQSLKLFIVIIEHLVESWGLLGSIWPEIDTLPFGLNASTTIECITYGFNISAFK
jgi:hypothetical protein